MLPRWLFTSDRFLTTINDFQSFPQRYFYYDLSWPSSDLIKSLGLRPIPYSLNSTLEIIGPHNSPSKSCFAAPRKERKILISSSLPPCDFVSFSRVPRTPFYLLKAHLWCLSAQSASSFNFGDSLVPHVQWQDGNLTVEGSSWYTSGKFPACNFRATINNLSNQFFFTFNSYVIPELIHWICLSLSHSPVHLQIQKLCSMTTFQTCKFPWTLLVFFLTCEVFITNFLEN